MASHPRALLPGLAGAVPASALPLPAPLPLPSGPALPLLPPLILVGDPCPAAPVLAPPRALQGPTGSWHAGSGLKQLRKEWTRRHVTTSSQPGEATGRVPGSEANSGQRPQEEARQVPGRKPRSLQALTGSSHVSPLPRVCEVTSRSQTTPWKGVDRSQALRGSQPQPHLELERKANSQGPPLAPGQRAQDSGPTSLRGRAPSSGDRERR